MGSRLGFGEYQFEHVEGWPKIEINGAVADKGKPGAPGEPFNMPTHAVQGPDGDIFVSDGYSRNRIHCFAARGEHKLSSSVRPAA